MMWLMDILKICLKEWPLIKYDGINHLLFLKIQNMMNINVELVQWLTKKIEKNKLNTSFRCSILGTGLVDMLLRFKCNKGI